MYCWPRLFFTIWLTVWVFGPLPPTAAGNPNDHLPAHLFNLLGKKLKKLTLCLFKINTQIVHLLFGQ